MFFGTQCMYSINASFTEYDDKLKLTLYSILYSMSSSSKLPSSLLQDLHDALSQILYRTIL